MEVRRTYIVDYTENSRKTKTVLYELADGNWMLNIPFVPNESVPQGTFRLVEIQDEFALSLINA